jgi:hypothetical protein
MNCGLLPRRLESILLGSRAHKTSAYHPTSPSTARHFRAHGDTIFLSKSKFEFIFSPHITIVHKEEERETTVRISDGMRERTPYAKRRFFYTLLHLPGVGIFQNTWQEWDTVCFFWRQSFCISEGRGERESA